MKKYIFLWACLSVMGFSLNSCKNDSLVDNTKVTGTPEKDVAGMYSGTWTRILDTDTVHVENCMIELLSTDSAYFVDVKVYAATAAGLEEMLSVANIVQEGAHGYMFSNTAATATGFGVSFRGRVSAEDELLLNFVKTTRVGRKSYEYAFAFLGSKIE